MTTDPAVKAALDAYYAGVVMGAMKNNERIGNAKDYMAEIRAIIDEYDVVQAVWTDPASRDGINLLFLKGSARLAQVISSGIAADLKITGIMCIDVNHAHALSREFGERPDKLN